MILGHNEIHNRIAKGEVFRGGTCDPGCVKEASYVLRIAADGLLLDGKFYDPFSEEKRNWFQMFVRNVCATRHTKANGNHVTISKLIPAKSPYFRL